MRSEEEIRDRIRERGRELRGLARGVNGALDIAVFTLGGAVIDAQVKELEWVLGVDEKKRGS